jgi:stearoyl-CoA desaturase (delta-9 desaturase)
VLSDAAHERNLKAVVLILVVAPLLCVVAAVILAWNRYVFPSDLALMALFFVFAQIGVTIGYHRMLTHQGFEAPQWLRFLLLSLGTTAFEGGPAQWTATHIKHHAHSDEEDDPHSPLAGFWHAHIGWLFHLKNYAPVSTYAPHLLQDPVVMFMERWWYPFAFTSVVLPLLAGGWTGLIWGAGVRIFLTTHITYSVNSICHTFGRRDFDTTDESRNNWIVGLLAFGEGWHNNHHAFPRSAFHGMRWWQFDLSGLIIRFLESVGLVWNVQRVTAEASSQQKIRAANAMRVAQDLRMQLLDRASSLDVQLRSAIEKRILAPVNSDDTRLRQSLKRLEDIRRNLAESTHMKKVRLQRYVAEIQNIAAASAHRITATNTVTH